MSKTPAANGRRANGTDRTAAQVRRAAAAAARSEGKSEAKSEGKPAAKPTAKPAAGTRGTGRFYIDRTGKAWLDILARLAKVQGTHRVSDLAAEWGHEGWLVRNAAHEMARAEGATLKVQRDEAGRVCVVGKPAAKKAPAKKAAPAA